VILAVAAMYVRGASPRKVTAVVHELCGLEVTSIQVSHAVVQLDEQRGVVTGVLPLTGDDFARRTASKGSIRSASGVPVSPRSSR
jgi:hypothetical protein